MSIEATLLVPGADNDGNLFDRRLFRQLEDQLMDLAGGLTKRDGAMGLWRDQGITYADTNTEYTIAVQSWRQVAEFVAIADWARERFRQEAVYISIMGVVEILRSP